MAIAGCGGGGSKQLSAKDGVRVAQAEVDIATYCVDQAQGGFSAEHTDAEQRAIDTLTAMYRDDPGAVYDDSEHKRTMRQVVSDAATQLERCDAHQDAAALDRVRDSG